MDAKPVSPAKMRTEPIFRNTISVVAAAFVPGAMLTSPIACTLALPDVLPYIARSRVGPSRFAQLAGGMPAVRLMLRAPVGRFMGLSKRLVPLFRSVVLVPAVLRWRLARAFVLVNLTFLPVGTTFLVSRPAMLCVDKHCCSQQHSQD